MAGVHAQNGRLLVTFQYPHRGAKLRCREFLGLADSRENRRVASRVASRIEHELAAGSFDYPARFPASRMLQRLGLRTAPIQPLLTLAEYAQRWLAGYRAHLTQGSFYDYGLLISKHIAGAALGALALDQVARQDLDHWILELKAQGVGPRRINMALARLRTMFRMAEEEGLIARNPVRLVRGLREPRAAIDPFTPGEIQALLTAARPGTERAFIATLLLAGLRPSEALGLEWRDVDLRRALLSVRRSRSRWGPGMTKTAASEREVDIEARLLVELRALAALRRSARPVFMGPRGKGLDWNNFRQRSWQRVIAAAGLRSRPPYQCRHTYAASLLAAGANPQYVAHQMGHSTLAMVIRHYARWTRKPARHGRPLSATAT